MADEVINTRIVANADFSSLIADVHRVTASLSKLQEQLSNSNKMLANNVAVINRSFADTLRSTGQFSSHFVSLTSDVDKFGKNLDSGRLKLRDYFNTYQQHAKTTGGLIRQLAQQQVAMQNAILQPLGRNAEGLMQFNVHVPRGLDAIKSKTALAKQELMIMNKVIQDGAVQLINWGKNTQWAGRQLSVGLTIPLASFGKAAADAFKAADQELTRLTKVYGGIAATSATELKKIRGEVTATAAQLAKEYGASFQETISLAADIAATGKQGNELLASTKEATRLAVLGEVDRQDAMKATLAIQTAFKQNTTELSDSINFLNAVENQTSTSLADLVEAIPKAGPVIKGLGGSVKDLALYLTAMREGGISAAEGANALKSGLASLINPTDKAVNQFKGFGIDLLGIVNRNAGNVTGTLLELQSALDRLNPLQKQQAIENLFGKFQFARMNALFENLGKQGSQTLQVLDLMKASTADLANIAGREMAQVTESASGRYRRALESLKADLAGVGEQFLTVGTKLITIVDKALQFFNNLPKPIKSAITFIGALTALAGPLIMLTGLLANFFGYILKGVMHMKAFFKGGEGWKYLTPEMIAAEKAGKMIEQTFYSDAKAASILQVALKNLIDEFSVLEAKAKAGSVSVNPAVSTMAGNLIMGAGGGRVVNPNHPLAGEYGARASTHMVPRGSMTDEERMQQTIFGLVPGSGPVNRKIGQNPQIYMHNQLPDVPGLTTIGGTSTGVVAGEAARWHAMMATLGMQSKEEIASLKKTIATTGIVSKEFMQQFDQILPVVSAVTDNAAKESALIVAELRAGKINVAQAREQIIALNIQVERMIAEAVGTQATAMGRTINPTMVPTLNQPVVDATGKSNMRELFKKGKTKDLINKIAGSLGVRTSGAGYNIETTRPKKFLEGGTVVPGPRSETTDTQYAVLREGDFVLNRAASDNLLGFNQGGEVPAMVTPGEIVFHNPTDEETAMLSAYNNRFAVGGIVRSLKGNYGIPAVPRRIVPVPVLKKLFPARFRPELTTGEREVKGTQGVFGSSIGKIVGASKKVNQFLNKQATTTAEKYNEWLIANGRNPLSSSNKISRQKINAEMKHFGVPPDILLLSMLSGRGQYRTSADVLLQGLVRAKKITAAEAKVLSDRIFEKYAREVSSLDMVSDFNNPIEKVSAEVLAGHMNPSVRKAWQKFISTPGMFADKASRGSSSFLRSFKLDDGTEIVLDPLRGSKGSKETFYHAGLPSSIDSALRMEGYNLGGRVGRSKNNYGRMNLGMPWSIKNKNMANLISSRVGSSRFRNVAPIDYGHLIQETSGHSFPVRGVGGIYKNPNGDGFVFVKPMMDEMSALAELRATEIARRAHGLNSPRQTIRVMKDPTDLTGSRTFIALQSPYDPEFSAGGSKFTKRDFFKQLVASLVRGDKDLSASNVFGPNLADVGTAGVFSRASGARKFEFNMPSMADQAMVNLLGVKGGAKRAFAESTSDIARKMTPDAYHNAIIKEINATLPKMRETVNSFKLNSMERKVYERMISRLEEGLHTDWRPYQGIHANVKPKKYALGGIVSSGTSNYGKRGRNRAKAAAAADMESSNKMMATSFAGMGLMGVASMVGGPVGQAMNFAGMAMQMTPLLSFLPKLPPALTKTIGPFGKMAESVSKASGGLSGLGKVFNLVLKPLSLLLRAINPVTAGLTLLAVGVSLYVKHQKDLAEQHRITRLGFGMTAESAKKAGYNYTDYNKKVKDTISNLKAVAERNKMIYESMTQAGVPFKMTIEQYKKLKETVQSTMGDYVKLFDATKVKDVGQVAVQLKAQFMAAGDSVEEATAKIYTLLAMSNKASMAASTIGSKAFQGIKNVNDAAETTIKTFNAASQVSDAKGQVDALLSAFTALDAATAQAAKDNLKNNKDKGERIKSEYELAYDIVEKINSKLGTQKNLTADVIKELGKTNPELAQILTTSDTVVSAFEKLKLLSSGININVSQLNSVGVNAAAQIASAVQAAVRNNAVVAQQSKAYETLKGQIAAAEKAQKGLSAKQQIDSRKTIEGLQKQIDLIKKAAQEKIDAIRKQTEQANAELDIQKEQLAAQQALVSGDMAGYAESQLNIKQIVNTQQQKVAEDAINKKAELDIKPLQDQIDALNNKNQDLADSASLAGDRLNVLQKRAGTLNENLTTYTSNLDNLAFKVKTLGESFKGSDEYKQAMAALEEAGKKLGITADPRKVLDAIVSSLGNVQADLVNVYLANGGKAASFGMGLGTKSSPILLTPDDIKSDPAALSFADKSAAIKKYGLTRGQFFEANGTLYEVDWGVDNKGWNYKGRSANPVKRAGGGRLVPGIPYMLNDGGKTEGIKFDMPGMVYPNINTMPKYNIPTQTKFNGVNISNSPSSNNVYNIDIALNGTNVTADDVIRKFKAELALVNAREGNRTRVVGGGSY